MLKIATTTRTRRRAQYVTPATALDLGEVHNLSAWERARLAAEWYAGRVDLRPTVRNAVKIFSISSPYICAATNGNDKPTAPARKLAAAWRRASDGERRAFARTMAEPLWNALDNVTAPPRRNGHAGPVG